MVATKKLHSSKDTREHEKCEHETPSRVRVQAITEFVQWKGLNIAQHEIFTFCEVKHTTGWKLLKDAPERRVTNRPENQWNLRENRSQQPRGRKRKLSETDLDRMENIIEIGGIDYRAAGWLQIGFEADIDGVCERTIHRRMQERGYKHCVACQKVLLSWKTVGARQEFYSIFIQYTIEQWKCVRFSDETHFFLGPKRKLQIIRKAGERFRCDCVQRNSEPSKSEKAEIPKYHAWAAVGYNFKSKLILYNASNNNGKMTQKIYLEQILPEVQSWIDRGDDFILEEDRDSAHTGKLVQKKKKEMGLRFYLNAPSSPDMSPVENIWRVEKQGIKETDRTKMDDAYKRSILDNWASISLDTINNYILGEKKGMRARLQALAANGGGQTQF